MGDFAPNHLVPGTPTGSSASLTGADLVRRALRLLGDFAQSVRSESTTPTVSMTAAPDPPTAPDPAGTEVGAAALGAAIEALGLAIPALAGISAITGPTPFDPVIALVDSALREIRASLRRAVADDRGAVRIWHLISVVLAQVRGIVAEGLLDDPAGFARLNDEDYRDWIVRHGADPVAADSTLISGLYDLVFGFVDAHPDRPGFGAGLGVFLSGKTFFDVGTARDAGRDLRAMVALEAVFDDPAAYQPARNAPHNLVYGVGMHACPGRPLATYWPMPCLSCSQSSPWTMG